MQNTLIGMKRIPVCVFDLLYVIGFLYLYLLFTPQSILISSKPPTLDRRERRLEWKGDVDLSRLLPADQVQVQSSSSEYSVVQNTNYPAVANSRHPLLGNAPGCSAASAMQTCPRIKQKNHSSLEQETILVHDCGQTEAALYSIPGSKTHSHTITGVLKTSKLSLQERVWVSLSLVLVSLQRSCSYHQDI